VRAAGKIVVILVLLLVAAAGVGWLILRTHGPTSFAGGTPVDLADYHGPAPTGAPPDLAGADLVKRGEYLARAGDCAACHNAPGGKPYAGGYAFKLPFGTIYSSNITPDKETGIGNWNDADFLRAMHDGIGKDGENLYPAFPYTSYTLLTDGDLLAIKAYLFSLKPVHYQPPADNLTFPFNQRFLMKFWNVLFNPGRRFEPNSDRPPEWNRGAYLAEALGHCGDCHTPRNLMFGLSESQKDKNSESRPSALWKRVVGRVWLAMFMVWTVPGWMYLHVLGHHTRILPFSVLDLFVRDRLLGSLS